MLRLWDENRITSVLRCFGLTVFAGYIIWNIYWLIRGRLPPSIWSTVTGLPCPSSGFTRSLVALVRGDYIQSILFNPFAIPFLLLFGLSFFMLLKSWRNKRELVLPPIFAWLWLITLSSAWISKFLIGPNYW